MIFGVLRGLAARAGRRGAMTGGAWRGGYFEKLEVDIIADEAYNMAFEMCGNDGQVSIIERTTWGAFIQATMDAVDGMGALNELILWCPHPDAVEVILEECAQFIEDTVEENREALNDSASSGGGSSGGGDDLDDEWNDEWD